MESGQHQVSCGVDYSKWSGQVGVKQQLTEALSTPAKMHSTRAFAHPGHTGKSFHHKSLHRRLQLQVFHCAPLVSGQVLLAGGLLRHKGRPRTIGGCLRERHSSVAGMPLHVPQRRSFLLTLTSLLQVPWLCVCMFRVASDVCCCLPSASGAGLA